MDLAAQVGGRLVKQFGDEGPAWSVVDVTWASSARPTVDAFRDVETARVDGTDPEAMCPTELRGSGATLLVEFRGLARRDRASVHLPVWLAPAECLVVYADQLQDQVWESSTAWGRPLPRCPVDESYPLVPQGAGG